MIEEKVEFPLSDAKEFLDIQHEFEDLDMRLMDLGRNLFYKYKEDGFVFSNSDPRVSEYTILKDLSPEDLPESDREKYHKIEILVEEKNRLFQQIEAHKYNKWFSESLHLKNALDKYLEKVPVAKFEIANDYNVYIFVREVTGEFIRFFERDKDRKRLSGHVLTKSKRNKLTSLSKKLLNELNDMTDIVASDSQMIITDLLAQFVDELNSDTESSGLAAKKNHAKLNREVLIKSLSSYFYEVYDDIPVEVIVDIVSIVDPDVTERKVYEIVSKVREFLQIQKRQRFN